MEVLVADDRPFRIQVDLLTEERRGWVQARAAEDRCAESDVIRAAVDAAIEAHQRDVVEEEEHLEPRERFLRSVRQWFTLELAAEHAGVRWREVERWLRGRQFLDEVQRAQWVFLADVEHRMLRLGQGSKGNALAFGEFLKAHHPHYGRAKQEELLRGWARLQDDLLESLSEEFGPQQAEALERAIKRFEQRKEVRLATRT